MAKLPTDNSIKPQPEVAPSPKINNINNQNPEPAQKKSEEELVQNKNQSRASTPTLSEALLSRGIAPPPKTRFPAPVLLPSQQETHSQGYNKSNQQTNHSQLTMHNSNNYVPASCSKSPSHETTNKKKQFIQLCSAFCANSLEEKLASCGIEVNPEYYHSDNNSVKKMKHTKRENNIHTHGTTNYFKPPRNNFKDKYNKLKVIKL